MAHHAQLYARDCFRQRQRASCPQYSQCGEQTRAAQRIRGQCDPSAGRSTPTFSNDVLVKVMAIYPARSSGIIRQVVIGSSAKQTRSRRHDSYSQSPLIQVPTDCAIRTTSVTSQDLAAVKEQTYTVRDHSIPFPAAHNTTHAGPGEPSRIVFPLTGRCSPTYITYGKLLTNMLARQKRIEAYEPRVGC